MSHATNSIKLSRDCASVRIPSGEAHQLASGTEVFLSQELGGSFTHALTKVFFALRPRTAMPWAVRMRMLLVTLSLELIRIDLSLKLWPGRPFAPALIPKYR